MKKMAANTYETYCSTQYKYKIKPQLYGHIENSNTTCFHSSIKPFHY